MESKVKEQQSIPTSKVQRAAKFISTGAKVGGNYMKHYAKKVVNPSMTKEELHTNNATDIYNSLSELKGSALKVAQMMSMDNNMRALAARAQRADQLEAQLAQSQGQNAGMSPDTERVLVAYQNENEQLKAALAAAMRAALEPRDGNPEPTVALVTPDRNLARRVVIELTRYRINVKRGRTAQ